MTVLLLDKDNNIISSTENTSLSPSDSEEIVSKFTLNELPSDGTIFEYKLNHITYNGFVTSSENADFKYVTLLNKEKLLDGISLIRYLTVGLIIFCSIVSIFITFSITGKMFEPIKKVIEYIKIEIAGKYNYDNSENKCKDVYLIEKFISYMKERNGLLQCRIDSYTSIMQEMMLTELIYSVDAAGILEKYKDFNMSASFHYKYFTIFIVPTTGPDNAAPFDNELFKLHLNSLQNSDKYSSAIKVFSLVQSDKIILIINSKQQTKGDIIKDFSDDLKAVSTYKDNANYTYAYGKTYSSLENLHDSFHQAINILTLKAGNPTTSINYDKAMNTKYITSNYTKDTESRLIKLVKGNPSSEAVKSAIIDIINQNRNDTELSRLKLESLFVQLIMTINRIMDEMELNSSDIFGNDINHYRIIDRYPTIEEKENYVLDAFEKLTSYIRSIKTNKAYDIYQHMLNHVLEHYQEDISLNDISYSLGLSCPYLSNVFKEFHNTNFLDYLNGYRITKAKELLSTTNISINDIASKVGYSNVNTFIRVFKKLEDITPGQYRMKNL